MMISDRMNYRTRRTDRVWLRRIVIGTGMLSFVGAVVWGGMNLGHGPSGPKRQVARIMVLPDTPPPPPPPPEEKRPPKEEQPKQQVETPKPQVQPEPEQLKMAGQAGEVARRLAGRAGAGLLAALGISLSRDRRALRRRGMSRCHRKMEPGVTMSRSPARRSAGSVPASSASHARSGHVKHE